MFKPATRKSSKLRMTLDGPAGSGKTYTALRFAHALANGGRIAYIDTERGSASKYVGEAPDGIRWAFDVEQPISFSPERYTELIHAAGRSGYAVLVIDSLSHAWEGEGGALDLKEKASGNDYTKWRSITPIHNRMVDAILQAPMHVITCMRSKMDYIMDTDDRGKVVGIRKIGLAPIQRSGMEYEFDIVCDIDWSHIMTVSKSRCSAVADMRVDKPGPAFMMPVIEWLNGDYQQPEPQPTFVPASPVIEPQSVVEPAETLDSLMGKYGPDAVMEKIITLLDGRMPANDQEVAVLADALKA